MKKVLFVTIIIVSTVLYLYLISDELNSKNDSEGQMAPTIKIQSPDSKYVGLEDYRGKVILLHFWATWCPPCVEEIPTLDALNKKFADNNFILIAVSLDESKKDIADFRKKLHFDFPVFHDSTQMAAEVFKTYKLPESYLIDQEGRVVEKISGPQNWKSPVWEARIQKLLGLEDGLLSLQD